MSKRKHVHAKRKSNTRPFVILGGIVLALIIGILIYTQAGSSQKGIVEISPEEAFARYQAGAFLLDVRDQEEWDEYHVPDTTLIPLDQLQDRLNEVPRDQEVVIICRSGNRSKEAARILLKASFTNVTSMRGGLKAWSALGYALEGTGP